MANNQAHPDSSNLPYYVATYKGRSVAIKRDADYQNTIKLVQKSIPKLRPADTQDIFMSTTLVNYGDALVQISEEIWPDVVGDVKSVEITLENDDRAASDFADVGTGNQNEDAAAAVQDTHAEASSPRATDESVNPLTPSRDSFSISLRTVSEQRLELEDVSPSSKIRDIKSLIETRYHIPAALLKLELLGERLKDVKTLDQSCIAEWTTVDAALEARQCMIHVFRGQDGQTEPPKNIEVHLSYNRAWELAMRRPTPEVPPEDFIQTASWNLDITKNGMVLDHSSNAERKYLFWDGM
ncbi:hypothetical protein FRC10_009642 [Ceratobasidium sp. 414]|nr:hypothetical protein FRC10_009642 [Ceratobasidium sp. 414]